MSSKKFNPYENKRGNARSHYSESKFGHSSGSSGTKRDVFPQFSEPEDYGFSRGAHCSSFQPVNRSYQSTPNIPENKTWVQPHSSDHTQQFGNTLPLYQPLPTFRQYLNEENDPDDIPRSTVQGSMVANRHHSQALLQKGNEKFHISTENEANPERPQQEKNKKLNIVPPLLLFSPQADFMSVLAFQIETSSSPLALHFQMAHTSLLQALIGTRQRHMIGTVDQVTRWHKMAKHSELEILYEVAGKLESTINKGVMQLLFIRSDSGHILQGVFYTIDRELPVFSPGSIITATGSMIGSNKMQIFDANQISRDDFNAVQRLAFLSQRAMEEVL